MGRSNLAFRKAHPHASSYHKFKKLGQQKTAAAGGDAAATAAAAAEARRPRLASNAYRYEEADDDAEGAAGSSRGGRAGGDRDMVKLAEEAESRGAETFWRFRGEKEWDAAPEEGRPAPLAIALDYEAVGRNLRFLSLAKRLRLEPHECLPEDLRRTRFSPPRHGPGLRPRRSPRPAPPNAHRPAPAPVLASAPPPPPRVAAAEDDDAFLDELLGPAPSALTPAAPQASASRPFSCLGPAHVAMAQAPAAAPPLTASSNPKPAQPAQAAQTTAAAAAGGAAGEAKSLDAWLDDVLG
eukprot:tig00020515_g9768.t1